MKIVTWNINSVRLRLDNLARVVRALDPDVICLQETKAEDGVFPTVGVAALGYTHQAIAGMKSYNGVAILSRLPFKDFGTLHWCGKEDCRHAFAVLPGDIEIHSVYVPAGGDIPDPKLNDKFAHKLAFLDGLTEWAAGRQSKTAKRILVGDLNIAPLETDVWDHKKLLKVVSHTPVEVERFAKMQAAGPWIDAMRLIVPPEERLYTWWSYRARDWAEADRGRRLDHIWVSPALTKSVTDMEILKPARGWDLASDHVPVSVTITE